MVYQSLSTCACLDPLIPEATDIEDLLLGDRSMQLAKSGHYVSISNSWARKGPYDRNWAFFEKLESKV